MRREGAKVAPVWTLPDRIRKARQHAGLDQHELAARTGISRNAISSYENGTTTPRGPQLRALADECGVSYEWLTTGRTDGGEDIMGILFSPPRRLPIPSPRTAPDRSPDSRSPDQGLVTMASPLVNRWHVGGDN